MPFPTSPDKIRDHLANERTHLAWVRTGIALLGFGVVVARLPFAIGGVSSSSAAGIPALGHGERALVLGLLFCVVGIVALALSASNYTRNRKAIDTGEFIPAGMNLMVLTGTIGLLAVASILFLLRL